MKIAVNTRVLISNKLEGVGIYTDEIVRRIALEHPEDEFHLFFDRRYEERFVYGQNVEPHSVPPQARHPFLFYIWFQQSLRRKLDRLQPDLFFSPDSFMPLGMDIPSVITIHDLAVFRYPEHVSALQRWYYHTFMPRFAREAAHILTVSEFSKREIIRLLGVLPEKVTVTYNGYPDQYRPLGQEQIRKTREKYADGKPYLLYVGSIHPRKNVANLIRAYDLFRKTSTADIKLLLTGRPTWKYGDVEEAYKTARYRNDIVRTGFLSGEDLALVTGSAEAMTYLSIYEGFGIPVIEAMAAGVPVITSAGTSMAEVADDAALLTDPASVEDIAAAMKHVVENKQLRESLIEKGFGRAARYSWESAAKETYRVLKQFAGH